MSIENIEGKVTDGLGRAESAAGDLADNPKLKIKGESRQFQGKIEGAVGATKDAMNSAADQLGALFAKAGGQARDMYGVARGRAQDMADTIDPFVREKPYTAMAIGLAAGLILGGLFLNNAARVVYLKSVRD
jgi:uncharacterized protein YjbJ (UPF0337 family)